MEGVRDAFRNAGRRALAGLILIAVAYLVFKLALGIVAGIVWVLVAVVAIAAVIWALRAL